MDSLHFGYLASQASIKLHNYLHHLGVSETMLALQMAVHYQRLIDAGAQQVTTKHHNELAGIAVYRYSEFDSKILALKTAKIDLICSLPIQEVAEKLTKKLIRTFEADELEYVTVRLNAADIVMIQALENHGFQIVDGYILSLRKREVVKFNLPELPLIIRPPLDSDIPILQKKIAPTFIYSRFFRDPVLNSQIATEMHSQWIENSLKKIIIDEAFVAELEGEPVGFITLEADEKFNNDYGVKLGHIALVGVDPEHRGKQISQRMTEAVINGWFADRGVDHIRIETQLINYPAARSYEQSGFRIVDSAVTLRWRKSGV